MATPAVRNNNPGNLRDPNTGVFRQFATQEEGYAALLNDLEAKRTGNTRTGLGPQSSLSQFAGKYAPAEDSNDPVRYSQNLASQLGTTPDAPISQVDIGKLAMAVAHNEDPSAPGMQGDSPEFISDEQYAQMQNGGNTPEFISDQEYAGMQGQEPTSVPQYHTQPQLPQAPEAPPESQKETLGDKLQGRLRSASDTLTDAAQGKMGLPIAEVPLQLAGAIAGGIGDTVGSALSFLTPDFIEKPITGLVGNLVNKAANTGVGKAITQGAENFSQEHPQLSKDFGSAFNIASLAPISKGLSLAKGAGEGIVANTLKGRALKETADVVSAPLNKKSSIEAFSKAGQPGGVQKKGLVGRYVVEPDERTMDIARDAQGLVDAKNPIKSIQNLRGEITRVADKELRPFLQANGQTYNPLQLDVYLKQLPKPLSLKTSAEASRAYSVVLNAAQQVAARYPRTMEGLWDARQAIDDMIEREFGDIAFESAAGTGARKAAIAVRNGINDFIGDGLGNTDIDLINKINEFTRVAKKRGIDVSNPSAVKAQFEQAFGIPALPEGEFYTAFWKSKLKKMSNLYTAVDNIAEKNWRTIGKSAAGRFAKEHPTLTGFGKKAAEMTGFGGAVNLLD